MLEALNDQQREAVLHDGGPLLVVAGAGTGKTTALAHRVAQLIARGVPQCMQLAGGSSILQNGPSRK